MPYRLNAAALRERAREHRETAKRDDNPTIRDARIRLATEYERLAGALDEPAKNARD